jgi:two-component system cell cycle sensor histidine kinase/response regulator CckA
MEQSALDLLPFVKELDKMLGRVLPETIRMELTYQPGSYWVNADPTRLQQVFLNLALNARDAMPEGGRLNLALGRIKLQEGSPTPVLEMPPGEWIRITIKDTGTGIPPEVLPHIFDPFFTTKPAGQGTGLGLAQVYGIIKQHDGFIDVESKPGEGATFFLYLPVLSMPEKPDSSSDTRHSIQGVGETVVVVEDNIITRTAIQALLETQNYQVLTASNGADALEIIQQADKPISLVISVVVMPQMGGVALYQTLQEHHPHIKMLFVTGHPLEEKNQALLETSSIHWLQKPFSVADFNRAVYKLIKEKGDENEKPS